jgi:CCR4-NOT complex subunit CAF16
MQLGKTPTAPLSWPPAQSDVQSADEAKGDRGGSTLLGIALGWLRDDRDLRKKRELEAGGAKRGAKKDVSLLLFILFSRFLFQVVNGRLMVLSFMSV